MFEYYPNVTNAAMGGKADACIQCRRNERREKGTCMPCGGIARRLTAQRAVSASDADVIEERMESRGVSLSTKFGGYNK